MNRVQCASPTAHPRTQALWQRLDQQKPEILALYEAVMPVDQIGHRLGFARESVAAALKAWLPNYHELSRRRMARAEEQRARRRQGHRGRMRECRECHQDFEQRWPKQVYCGETCRLAQRRARAHASFRLAQAHKRLRSHAGGQAERQRGFMIQEAGSPLPASTPRWPVRVVTDEAELAGIATKLHAWIRVG